jgi:hypothetical protein
MAVSQQLHSMPALLTVPVATFAPPPLLLLPAAESSGPSTKKSFSLSLRTPASISHVRTVCFFDRAAVVVMILLFLLATRLHLVVALLGVGTVGEAEGAAAETALFLFLPLLGGAAGETAFGRTLPWAPGCVPAGSPEMATAFLLATFFGPAGVVRLLLGARGFRRRPLGDRTAAFLLAAAPVVGMASTGPRTCSSVVSPLPPAGGTESVLTGVI